MPSLEGGLLDSETAKTIVDLEREKSNAINIENFDLAKDLKNQIDQLKSIGARLKTMES
jgi:hypothetical protein